MLNIVFKVGFTCEYTVDQLIHRIEVFFFDVVLVLETAAVSGVAVVLHMRHLVPLLELLSLARVNKGNDFADINELSFNYTNQPINIFFAH